MSAEAVVNEDAEITPGRQRFLLRVYGILIGHLISTVLLTFIAAVTGLLEYAAPSFSDWFAISNWFGICTICLLGAILHDPPWSYMFLVGLVISESFLLSGFCYLYTFNSIIPLTIVTSLLFGCLTLCAKHSQKDFTTIGIFLLLMLFGLVGISIVNLALHSWFGLYVKRTYAGIAITVLVAALGILISCLFTVQNSQMVLKETVRQQFDLDQYMHAAMALTFNVLVLFAAIVCTDTYLNIFIKI